MWSYILTELIEAIIEVALKYAGKAVIKTVDNSNIYKPPAPPKQKEKIEFEEPVKQRPVKRGVTTSMNVGELAKTLLPENFESASDIIRNGYDPTDKSFVVRAHVPDCAIVSAPNIELYIRGQFDIVIKALKGDIPSKYHEYPYKVCYSFYTAPCFQAFELELIGRATVFIRRGDVICQPMKCQESR